MSIGEFPDPDKRERQVAKMSNQALRVLITQCVNVEPERRPSMAEIISRIENEFD